VPAATVPIVFARWNDRFIRVSTGPYYDLEDRNFIRGEVVRRAIP
jgi:hypothetical protein